jgi:hypothetical protein
MVKQQVTSAPRRRETQDRDIYRLYRQEGRNKALGMPTPQKLKDQKMIPGGSPGRLTPESMAKFFLFSVSYTYRGLQMEKACLTRIRGLQDWEKFRRIRM